MKPTITYKEITIALGVLVALVVVLTFWVNSPIQHNSVDLLPNISYATSVKSYLAHVIVFF